MSSKKLSWRNCLLWTVIFSHVFPLVISAYKDRMTHLDHSEVRVGELRYWLWFFTWWSAWTSLLTIIWSVHKLFFFKKEHLKSSYSSQLMDLVVTETNLISGVVFCLGGFLLTVPLKGTIPSPFGGRIEKIHIWMLYNAFWHIFGPALVFFYFWKYCLVNKLVENMKKSLVYNLINPAFYFFYVLLRPEVIGYYNKLKGNHPYNYPHDYPYFIFFWSVGKPACKNEQKFFWHSWPRWSQILFWFSVIFFLIYLGFSLLLRFLVRIKTEVSIFKKEMKTQKESLIYA